MNDCEVWHDAVLDPKDPEAGLIVSVPRNSLTDDGITRLQKMVDGKSALIKKVLGTESLPVVVTEDKISFPWFPDPNADEFVTYAEFIDRLCAAARLAQRVNSTKTQIDSEKYAMRCWLIRLGFVGPQYKKARKILTRNLTGAASYKHAPAEST